MTIKELKNILNTLNEDKQIYLYNADDQIFYIDFNIENLNSINGYTFIEKNNSIGYWQNKEGNFVEV